MSFGKCTFIIRTKRVPYLINRACREGIAIGDVTIGDGCVSVSVSHGFCGAFRRLLLAEGTDFEERRKKIPFRPVLIASLCVVVAAVIVFNFFVYGVRITGNRYVNTAQIYEVLAAHRVDGFTYKRSLDLDAVRRDVTALEGISFASVGIKGNTLYVDVKEELPAENAYEENHSPVLATRTGIITKVIAESGTPCVRAGDAVSAGEPLIEPVYRFTEGEAAAPAKGEVWARTVYRKEIVLPQISVQNERTGRECSIRILRMFGREYAPDEDIPYASYDRTEKVVFSCGFVTVTERTYHERADIVVYHDLDLEVPAVLDAARKELLAEVPYYAYAIGGVVAEEKKMDSVYYIVLYLTVEQRIDSLFLPIVRQTRRQ